MITVLGLALGAVFLLLPLCVAYIYGIGMNRRLLVAFAKMLLRVGIFGAVMYFLMQSGGVWLSLLLSLLLVAYSTLVVCVKARLRVAQFLVPVGVGMLVSVAVSGSILLFANISMGGDFCVRYVLPVVALLSGGMAEPVGKALSVYYAGLLHHNHLYYYLLGNGASRIEAMRYLQRHAVMQSFVPGLRTMSAIGVGVSPVMMWTMLMGGMSAVEAACWQMLIVLGVFASSVMAVVVALVVARRYVFGGYARIKAADGKAKSESVSNTAVPDAATTTEGEAENSESGNGINNEMNSETNNETNE